MIASHIVRGAVLGLVATDLSGRDVRLVQGNLKIYGQAYKMRAGLQPSDGEVFAAGQGRALVAGARGRIYRHRKLAELPFIVECLIPGGGLRERLDAIHAWAQRTCGNERYTTSSRRDRSASGTPQDVLRVHFADNATARAFASEFGLPYP